MKHEKPIPEAYGLYEEMLFLEDPLRKEVLIESVAIALERTFKQLAEALIETGLKPYDAVKTDGIPNLFNLPMEYEIFLKTYDNPNPEGIPDAKHVTVGIKTYMQKKQEEEPSGNIIEFPRNVWVSEKAARDK